MGTNYYLRGKECPTCGHQPREIHIGKQSAGWKFLFYTNENLPTTWEEWKKTISRRLKSGKTAITNEYGEQIEFPVFCGMIEAHQGLISHYNYLVEHKYSLDGSYIDPNGYEFYGREFS